MAHNGIFGKGRDSPVAYHDLPAVESYGLPVGGDAVYTAAVKFKGLGELGIHS
jgi:hypothetical protein